MTDNRKLFLALALLAAFWLTASICAPLRGAEPSFVNVATGEYVLILPTGKLVRLTVGAEGAYTIVAIPISQLGAPPANPPEKPPVKPPVTTTLKQVVTDLLTAVMDADKPQTSQAVAKIYRATAAMASEGAIKTPADLRKATDMLFTPLMSAIGKLDLWKGFKAGVDAATKDVASLDDCVAAWGVVADTLEAVK